MRKKLQTKLLWFLVPPIVACALLLGPLRSTTSAASDSTRTSAATLTDAVKQPGSLQLPETPGLWQVGSALIGVLLVGAAGVMLIARLKGINPLARPGDGTELLTLRQSLRVSSRHHVHAIEFNGRVILLGECDSNLVILTTTDDPNIAADEHTIGARSEETRGVDLRDTPVSVPVSPRIGPSTAAREQESPQRSAAKRLARPTTKKASKANPTKKQLTGKRASSKKRSKPTADDLAAANLADFKTLLRRARKKASV